MYRNVFSLRTIEPRLKELKLSFFLLNKNILARISLIIVAILILLAIFAPLLIPYPAHVISDVNPSEKLLAPSGDYFFGTDELGRDIFSRVIYGTRISLLTALIAVSLSMVVGVILGALAGSLGRKTDEIIMRVTDIFLSFPPLLLAISIAAILGPSLRNAILAIAISWWPWYTRLVRGQAISIRERPFIKAAEAIGTPRIVIILKHIIPNCISPVIVQASMDMGGVILTISSLSFLGLGAQAPTPEWGLMISTSRNYFLNAWWYSLYPGLAIFLSVLVFNLLGDGLREILDPKTRKN